MKNNSAWVLIFLLSGCQEIARPTLNMENTISPLIDSMLEKSCGYQNVQVNADWAQAGALIYKREPDKRIGDGCISHVHNEYYARCYEWKYSATTHLLKRATRDVDLQAYSCIDENEIRIPYADEGMQTAKIGVVYED